MTQAQSVRFSRTESPAHINDGRGWTTKHAVEWLNALDLDATQLTSDDGYLRYKQYEAGAFIGSKFYEDDTVMVMRCARNT